MFAKLLNLSLLTLALPIATLASYHGNPILNRNHHDIARRADGNVNLFKRGPNSRWSFYNVQTGNALVPSPTRFLSFHQCWLRIQWILWTIPPKQRFCMFLKCSPYLSLLTINNIDCCNERGGTYPFLVFSLTFSHYLIWFP